MFWADFFADTRHVSGEAAGAYLLLLGHAWLRGAKLPNDDRALARMADVSPRKWASIKRDVMSFWTLDGDVWRQKRLSKEWDYVCRTSDIKRRLGKLGGLRSAQKRSAISTEPSKQTVNQTATAATATATAAGDDLFGGKEEKHVNGKQLVFIGEQWNALAGTLRLPSIDQIKSGSTRERHALARLREMADEFPSVEQGVSALMTKVRESAYLRGEINSFRCTFDWILCPSNFTKIMEGNYENRKKQ